MKKKTTLKEWFMRVVPHHVSDRTLLFFWSLGSISGIPSNRRIINREINEDEWQDNSYRFKVGKYIEKQSLMKDMYYGVYKCDYNSCEVIAAYNAMQALDFDDTFFNFPELLENFEKKGITVRGAFGTSPKAICAYFKKMGFTVKILKGKRLNPAEIEKLSKEYETFIMTAYNDAENLEAMVHTISITKEKESFEMHNEFNFEGKRVCYNKLIDAVNGFSEGRGKPICLMGIEKVSNDINEFEKELE